MHVEIMKPMRADSDSIGRGSLRDAAPLRDTSTNGSVRLQNFGGAFVKELFESSSSRLDFACGNENTRRSCELAMVLDVIGTKRFLDPVRMVFFETSAVEQRGWQIQPCVVDVHHQLNVRTGGFAGDADALFFLRR